MAFEANLKFKKPETIFQLSSLPVRQATGTALVSRNKSLDEKSFFFPTSRRVLRQPFFCGSYFYFHN
jgi:hypothetical protein